MESRAIFIQCKTHWSLWLSSHKRVGKKIAIYGAAQRACSFINLLDLGKYLDFVVDDHHQKQKFLMPGSKLPIKPSSALVEEKIDICLMATNPDSQASIIKNQQFFLEQGGKFFSIYEGVPKDGSDRI